MKVAPVMNALASRNGVDQVLVHTGQHYDADMSDIFFQQLGIRAPDMNLQVGSASHTIQTSQIMMRLEEVLNHVRPDRVLVYGDVNSTLAAALVCAKMLIPLGHVEAGLRSGDRTMPEEINRLVTDQLADQLFTPSRDADQNLLKEGICEEKIHFVGNVMIDTLLKLLPQAQQLPCEDIPERFALVTLHRPSNVDSPDMLAQMMSALVAISYQIPVLFPIHPRTRQRLQQFNVQIPAGSALRLMEPIGYIEFLSLQRRASLVITDSGGIQEESTFLDVPCLTVRENTERPVTITYGTNILVGQDMNRLCAEANNILNGKAKVGQIPPLWDGSASERIAEVIVNLC
jgi:UDP-N-acetylglucosamine 2-epimerase (non-hydrolysing)